MADRRPVRRDEWAVFAAAGLSERAILPRRYGSHDVYCLSWGYLLYKEASDIVERFNADSEDFAADLRAMLAAQRELGPEMETEMTQVILARVNQYVASQVPHEVASRRVRRPQTRSMHLMGFPPALLALAVVLICGSVVFGVHVPLFPPVAMLILLVAFVTHRARHGATRSRATG